MGLIVRMPLINVNDEAAFLVRWLVADGVQVPKDEPIAIIETTKSAVDILADQPGFVRHLVPEGASYKIGTPVGFIAELADETLPELAPTAPKPAPARVGQANATKKAVALAARMGVDLAALSALHPDTVIGEDLVVAAASGKSVEPKARPSAAVVAPIALPKSPDLERVLILGGGGGAALVIDILSRRTGQKPVAILDNNLDLAGAELMGVPILGGFDVAAALWADGAFDALISTVVRDVRDRAEIFHRFTALGIPFTNVIDPDVRIGADVRLGKGNLIIYGGYLATAVALGDNNFLAAGTFIEHHSAIGNHCTFGPRSSLSGKVKVGDLCKFGTQVAVEPQVEIGAESLIASGVVLTTHVPPRSVVKSTSNVVIRNAK